MVASFRKKSFKFWSSSLPPYVHMVGGKGGCTFATVKFLLLVEIWQIFSYVALIFHAADDTVFKFRKSAFEVREMTRHPIIEFFR